MAICEFVIGDKSRGIRILCYLSKVLGHLIIKKRHFSEISLGYQNIIFQTNLHEDISANSSWGDYTEDDII